MPACADRRRFHGTLADLPSLEAPRRPDRPGDDHHRRCGRRRQFRTFRAAGARRQRKRRGLERPKEPTHEDSDRQPADRWRCRLVRGRPTLVRDDRRAPKSPATRPARTRLEAIGKAAYRRQRGRRRQPRSTSSWSTASSCRSGCANASAPPARPTASISASRPAGFCQAA